MNDIFLPICFLQLRKFSFLIRNIMNFYAVAKGRNPGIYGTWNECKTQVHKFPGPLFKKFNSKIEAENFIKNHSNSFAGTSLKAKRKSISTSAKKLDTLRCKRLLSHTKESTRKYENTSESLKSDNNFIVDENGYTEVYTDGSCTSNGKGNAKAGVGIWFSDNNSFNVSQPVTGRATNNMAEIQAVTIAAQQAHRAGIVKLKIITDSKFLISCITNWMPKWKRTGWKTSNGKDVINKLELIEMEKALLPLTVTWNHVRGHIGVHGNEMADMLARNGGERYRQT
ncbi:PREDICTED: ribonuclease H1 [Ceratosolen solmsi marchali]|uniref:Ribonuclease H1 n=1 Tax=Ceratosolen solmsi marchali TaxID=326594 RepID=A0AAJ6VLL4_9HYME|nr:PREDICTED: ribonuclease H1 [Ceratosolen solmsi marchali]XP_011494584.1 PREDICTED: ribonuclease H1 [Ceratosolen solmsi marchali]